MNRRHLPKRDVPKPSIRPSGISLGTSMIMPLVSPVARVKADAPANASSIILNADQQREFDRILAAIVPGGFHLLTGFAGSGKTTLTTALAMALRLRHLRVALTAPTHKAVAVLAKKLRAAGVHDVSCVTTHSLLSLTPQQWGDRQIFERRQNAPPVMQDVVVIDECSMVSADLMTHIRRHLPCSFVLFVGDPAQLPPVGETASQTFNTPSRSHLDAIVRQAEGNPILTAAHIIRASQGGPVDWSWCVSNNHRSLGLYRPVSGADAWMRRGFTSAEFQVDPDAYRCLVWTNQRVAEISQRVRHWIYGDSIPTPFMPGERALIRAPIIVDGGILFGANEEATVLSIEPDVFQYDLGRHGEVCGWSARVPSWAMTLRGDGGGEHRVHAIRDEGAYRAVLARVADEAATNRKRWRDHHAFISAMAYLQSIYAMTVHTSQGSTFKHCFIDVPDIARRGDTNLLEMQQLFYVAATRASHTLILVGVE